MVLYTEEQLDAMTCIHGLFELGSLNHDGDTLPVGFSVGSSEEKRR
jgi:hypothetical protein